MYAHNSSRAGLKKLYFLRFFCEKHFQNLSIFPRHAFNPAISKKSLTAKSLSVHELGSGVTTKPVSILTTDLPASGHDVERIRCFLVNVF
jgi:hypothetical protein